jgi:uracil phosphoribosyltransferase
MRVHVADHPLVAHKITLLRDERTNSATFRALAEELMILIGYEATKQLKTETVSVTTPVATTTGQRLSEPLPLVVPILRAGLGLLEGMLRLLPSAEVGFLGMVRNEETLEPTVYSERLPKDIKGRQAIIIDPMLATGGSLIVGLNYLFDRGVDQVTAVCLIGAPEGIAAVEEAMQGRDVTLVLACLDEKLNEVGYIVPGLGDAGDRLYGGV